MDIEWAHAMAPGASIVVLCATPEMTGTNRGTWYEDIPLGIATLAGLPGMSVISASYGWYYDYYGNPAIERTWDSTILQPALAAHPNVSVFAASGDHGADPELIYPSASPEVVSVGGTSLYLNANNTYNSEVGWNLGSDSWDPTLASGGGYSQAFPIP